MRKNKWPRRGLYLLIFLVVLYVAFWVALFNPLEGSVESLDTLLPGDDDGVTYYIRAPWGEIRKSPFFVRNVEEGAAFRRVEEGFELEEYLYAPIREIEGQVNESVPGFLGEFSVLEDLMGREVVLAGRLTGAGDDISQKIMNSPFVLLTRISWKARFMEVLKYEFVRKNIPGLTAHRDFYEYDVGAENVREGAPEEARYRYFARIKDVLVVTNDRELMERVVHFGVKGGLSKDSLAQDYWYYYDIRSPAEKGAMTAWVQVARGDYELGHALEGIGVERSGSLGDFVRAFFPISYTNTVLLRPGLGDAESIPLSGVIRLAQKVPDHLFDLHRLEGASIAGGVEAASNLAPRDGTFLTLWLKTKPRDFFGTLFKSLDSASREIFFGGAENGGSPVAGWSEERLASQLGDWFEEGVTCVWSRLPEADKIDLDTWEGGNPQPVPASSLFLTVRPRLDPKGLIDFFIRHHGEMGLPAPEKLSVAGGEIYKLPMTGDATMDLIRPGFALIGNQFVFSSNLGELTRIVEVAAGSRKALATSESFQAGLGAAHGSGNLFLFADVDRARPYLLDKRHQWAFEEVFFNAKELRKQLFIKLTTEHSDWDRSQIEREVNKQIGDAQYTMKAADFPKAIEEYKARMVYYEPFSWISLSTAVTSDTGGSRLDLKGEVRMKPAEGD